LIIAGVLGVALLILAILYFTGKLDGSRRNGGSAEGTSGSYGGSTGSSGYGSSQPSTGRQTTTMYTLAGTWGPGCPGARANAITFSSSGTYTAGAGSGSYTLSGNLVTLFRAGGGGSFPMRWELVSESMARVTNINSGTADTVYRCN